MKSIQILFLTTQLPYPPKSGGTVKSWKYVQHLAANYTLSVGSLLKEDDKDHLDAFKSKVSLQEVYTEEIKIDRTPLNLLRSYFQAACLNVFRNRSVHFKQQIAKMTKDKAVIIVDHYEMFQYVPSDFNGKVVMHTHNAEFMLWQRMSELENSNPIKKFILKVEAGRVKSYEKSIFSKSDLIFSTPSDIALYQQYQFDTSKHAITYHLGNENLLDLPLLHFEETEKAFTFIGTLSWEPNIDGLIWFLEHVWPIIIKKHADVTLYVLGKDPDVRIIKAAKNDQRILFAGFIKNLEEYLQKTRVYLAPLRFGSGMKVKVLEGLYRGVPTVSTTVGAEGLEISTEKEIMIADDAQGYAEHCIRLLEDKTVWENLRDNSRMIASKKYRWQPMFEKMDLDLKKILQV